jgi:hypothetical protein
MHHDRARRAARAAAATALMAALTAAAAGEPAEGRRAVLSLPESLQVPAERFRDWMREQGWRALLGSPQHFHVQDGALHLVSRPGPVHRDRFQLAIFDRERLLSGLETKVAVAVTPEGFRADPARRPVLGFTMTPLALPHPDADLRDSASNDAAFYLVVSFDTERREFHGRELPLSIAYVWANRPWQEPVGRDPDYADFLRYLPIGQGHQGLGERRAVRRDLRRDFRAAYPEHTKVPDVIQIALKVDSNTLGGKAASRVSRIWLAPAEAAGRREAGR